MLPYAVHRPLHWPYAGATMRQHSRLIDGTKEGCRMAPEKPRRPLKTTLVLQEDAVAALRELAQARKVSFAEVVRRALAMDKYLTDARNDGCRILVEDPEKLIKELVIF